MKTLEKIATRRGRRDEGPNIDLAGELAEARDQKGIAEIAAGLRSPDPRVRSDCIKVLYEIGHRDPGLIAAHVDDFAELLRSGQNRMVWGGYGGPRLCREREAPRGVPAPGSDPRRLRAGERDHRRQRRDRARLAFGRGRPLRKKIMAAYHKSPCDVQAQGAPPARGTGASRGQSRERARIYRAS